MSPRLRRVLATVALILAVALVVVLTLRALGVPIAVGPLASPTPLPVATESPTPAASQSVDEALAAIEAQVSDLRDLPPADIGPAEFVTRDELERRLAAEFEQDYPPDEVAADNAVLQGLGLLTADQDIAALQLQLLTGQVLGYYDDKTRSMVIVSDAGLTPEAEVTYAHEYTHALQDAAFDLDTMNLDATGDDDGAMARLGVVEGDATTAMVLWAIDNLTAEELLQISETPLPDTTGIPDWMLSQLEFPYTAGADFASQLWASGGFAAVDDAFADPPLTTEQVLHYPTYVDNEAPIPVDALDAAALPAGVEVVEDTTFGEAMLGIWLGYLGVDATDLDQATTGWGGDHLTGLTGPDGQVAIVLRLAWDSPLDTDEFEEAYTAALPKLPIFGTVERVSDTELVVYQGSSREFVESFIGPLD